MLKDMQIHTCTVEAAAQTNFNTLTSEKTNKKNPNEIYIKSFLLISMVKLDHRRHWFNKIKYMKYFCVEGLSVNTDRQQHNVGHIFCCKFK